MPCNAQCARDANLHVGVILAVADVTRSHHEVDDGEFYPSLYQCAHVDIRTTKSATKINLNLTWSHVVDVLIMCETKTADAGTFLRYLNARGREILNFLRCDRRQLEIATCKNHGDLLAVVAGSREALRPLLIGGDCGVCGGDVIGDGDLDQAGLGGGTAENGGFSVGGFFALFLAVVEILTMLIHSRLGKRQLFLFYVESDGALGCLF